MHLAVEYIQLRPPSDAGGIAASSAAPHCCTTIRRGQKSLTAAPALERGTFSISYGLLFNVFSCIPLTPPLAGECKFNRMCACASVVWNIPLALSSFEDGRSQDVLNKERSQINCFIVKADCLHINIGIIAITIMI